MAKQNQEPSIEPIIKEIGYEEKDRKWIVANRHDGRKLRGPFDTEMEAYASMKGKGRAKAD